MRLLMTDAEERVYRAIESYMETHQYMPSLREIAVASGLRSIGTVQRHLVKLRDKGYVEWTEGKKRTLRLVDG